MVTIFSVPAFTTFPAFLDLIPVTNFPRYTAFVSEKAWYVRHTDVLTESFEPVLTKCGLAWIIHRVALAQEQHLARGVEVVWSVDSPEICREEGIRCELGQVVEVLHMVIRHMEPRFENNGSYFAQGPGVGGTPDTPSPLWPAETQLQGVEGMKLTLHVQRRKILTWHVWYPVPFLAFFFTAMDHSGGGFGERLCGFLQTSCAHVWAFNNLSSQTECRERYEQLPLFNDGSRADGRSKACRMIHFVMADFAPEKHCEHLSFVPMQDWLGRVKCQKGKKNFNYKDVFSENELEVFEAYQRRIFANEHFTREFHGGELGGLLTPAAQNAGSSVAPADMGFRVFPKRNRLGRFGTCPTFRRVRLSRADPAIRLAQEKGVLIGLGGGGGASHATDDQHQTAAKKLRILQHHPSAVEMESTAGGLKINETQNYFRYVLAEQHVSAAMMDGARTSSFHRSKIDLFCSGGRSSTSTPSPKTLVLLHGMPHFHSVWNGVSTYLLSHHPGQYRIVTIDLPGMGGVPVSSSTTVPDEWRSDDERQSYHPIDVARALTEVLKNLKSNVTLVAHDYGGSLAWVLAHTAPSFLRRVIILNMPHPMVLARALRNDFRQYLQTRYMRFLALGNALDGTSAISGNSQIRSLLSGRKYPTRIRKREAGHSEIAGLYRDHDFYAEDGGNSPVWMQWNATLTRIPAHAFFQRLFRARTTIGRVYRDTEDMWSSLGGEDRALDLRGGEDARGETRFESEILSAHPKINIPVDVLWGERDATFRLDVGCVDVGRSRGFRSCAEFFSSGELLTVHRFPNLGHNLLLDDADAVASKIQEVIGVGG